MDIFICRSCGNTLNGFIPSKCNCGYDVPIINEVYQFTDDAPISVEGDGLKWLGYENVGENYRPEYFYNKENENLGTYANLADFLGKNKVILDIGTGLGECAISLAFSGLRVIAVDISQVMLEAAAKRAQKHNTPNENIIFARMNGYKIELVENSVDAVLAVDVLHQVNHPELMMDEILRVLKPDGSFLQPSGKSLGYTEEQKFANSRYNDACKDIQEFYQKTIDEVGYSKLPFSTWDKAAKCIDEYFIEYKFIDDTGAYWQDNVQWPLKLGLHKIKTKASGSMQLIPDDVHNNAWIKTNEYAKSKYGENYEGMTRFYNHTSGMVLFKHRI